MNKYTFWLLFTGMLLGLHLLILGISESQRIAQYAGSMVFGVCIGLLLLRDGKVRL
jgi:hypothetical protein